MGIIYKIENCINKKCYIGQTIRSLEKRWYEHCKSTNQCKALINAINKYKADNFTVEVIHTALDNELDELEIFYIAKFNSISPHGYNLESGGRKGKQMSEESCIKMKLSKLGYNNPNYGKERTIETKQKISQKKSGINHHFYGKELTNDHKLKLSKSHKNNNLLMYLIYLKERPSAYQAEGYAIINHPKGKNKYFTSKKLTLDDKYNLANKYLELLNTL